MRLGQLLRPASKGVDAAGGIWNKAGMQEAGVGKLVSFEKRRRIARVKAADAADAQILIFTGVRYERGPDPLPTNGTTPARPKRKRG